MFLLAARLLAHYIVAMSFGAFMQGVNPLGPIFGKELRVTARRRRTYYLRVVYLAALLVVLLITWSTQTRFNEARGAAGRAEDQVRLGVSFFDAFSIFLLFVMGGVGPILTATSVSSERLGKTLGVLLMTPLTSWQIISGKLFSRLLAAMTIIGLGLPVLAVVRLLGGVELEQMVGAIAVALVAVITAASIGLFFSTVLNRAYAIILLSYAAMMGLYGFVPFVVTLVWRDAGSPGSQAPLEFILATNPYAFGSAVIGGMSRRGMFAISWPAFLIVQGAFTLLLLWLSAGILRLRARCEGGGARREVGEAPPTLPIVAVARSAGIASAEADPTRGLPARNRLGDVLHQSALVDPWRGIGDNPIYWREVRRPLFSVRWHRYTAASVFIIMLLGLYCLIGRLDLHDPRGQEVWASFFCFFYACLAIVLSSTAIAQEKESDTWTLLLTTPISGNAAVWGKTLGVLRRLIGPTILFAAHFLGFAFFGIISFQCALAAMWIIISFNAIWIATGVHLSLSAAKVTLAVIGNFSLAILFYVLGPIAIASIGHTNFDMVFHPEAYAQVDPSIVWTYYAIVSLMILAGLGAAWSLFRLIRKPRAGLIPLICFAFIALVTAIGLYIAEHREYRNATESFLWWHPFVWLSAIIFSRDGLELYLQGQGQIHGVQAAAHIFAAGLANLAVAAAIVQVTAWKFNGLVGRPGDKRAQN